MELMATGTKRGRERRHDGFAAAAVLFLGLALLAAALPACGGAATDANEPNDEPNSATILVPGTPVDGVIGTDDSDVFRCDAPKDEAPHAFVVTVQTDAPEDVELQAGASIPGVWEGITWPGWNAVARSDRVELAGKLRKGTVLMFLRGASGTKYSIEIAWEE
jgi:hypothetical protein